MNNAEIELKRKVEHIRDEHEKTKILLESILDGIIAIDYFDNVLFSNKTFDSLFNLQQAKLFDNFKIWKLFEDQTIVNSFHNCLKQTQSQELKAHKIKTMRGELFFDIYFTPIYNNHNEVIGVMSVFHDVSELKKIDQMRVDFVANVSHEIRTPLTAIRGFAQILGQKIQPSEAHFLNRIIENSDHMLALFNDLLQLSVLESKDSIQKEEVDLQATFNYLCDSISQKYPTKKISCIYQVNTKSVLAEPRLFEQVITNLVDNAIKYHPQGEVELSLSCQSKNDVTIISIKDNGQGMEEKHLSRIFERFYRIDDARTKKPSSSGSGIGLSLVKHIMQKHGGKVEVQSTLGSGTEFKLYFPTKS
jgi:two-component system, OmpR family, phosphate regulon sensor histidine kinase PhoR